MTVSTVARLFIAVTVIAFVDTVAWFVGRVLAARRRELNAIERRQQLLRTLGAIYEDRD